MTNRPVANGGIYRDLTCQAVRLLNGLHGGRRRLAALTSVERCMLCEYASDPGPFEKVVTVGLTRGWAAWSSAVWTRRRCPRCLPYAASLEGVVCRAHVSRRDVRMRPLRDYLAELKGRLDGCGTDSEAALVEAVGWFAGWHPATDSVGI
jgi:hypothetical protein